MMNRFLYSNDVGTTTEVRTLNLPKLMSSANRKTFHNVDLKGNAQLYTVGIKIHASDAEATIMGASNTYVTRRAVKAWHDAREAMYKRAGFRLRDLGYGATLRPYLDNTHRTGDAEEIDTETGAGNGITPSFIGEEWTYSKAAVATPMEENQGTGQTTAPNVADLVDTYSFMLCGSSITENIVSESPNDGSANSVDQDSFVAVGMLDEWLDSFKLRDPVTQGNSLGADVIDADNALLGLMSQQGADKEEVIEIAREMQLENRPWGAQPSDYSGLKFLGYLKSVLSGSDYIVCQVPCGILQIATEAASNQRVYHQIEVLAIEDM